jgi:hypothetical protein
MQLFLGIISVFSLSANAFPGWNNRTLLELQKRANFSIAADQGLSPIRGPYDSDELIGDLIQPGPITRVGQVGRYEHSVVLSKLTTLSLLPISY